MTVSCERTGARVRTKPELPPAFRTLAWYSDRLLVAVNGAACSPHVDLAPDYQPAQFVVPASWHGASPFVETKQCGE